MRQAAHKFRSKTDAMNRRVMSWVCQHCRKWYHSNPKGQACVNCGCKAFFYFPSKAEARRFADLCLLFQHNKISDLEVQVAYPIVINGHKITTYKADFRYRDKHGQVVVEDVKGSSEFTTDVFKLKRKMVEAIYPIKITEVTPS